MVSIAEICADDQNKAIVEESSGFIVYQLVFMVAYSLLFLMCVYMLGSEWYKQKKIVVANNRYQVVLCLAIGSFVRLWSFLEVNCVFEEVFRSLKDIFFVTAFVLIVLFWIELQTGMRSMKSIQRLKPYLIVLMGVYAVFRIMASIADLFISGGVKNVFMGVTILIYAFVMGLGLYYGASLLTKMKTMQRSDIQARLQKLTRFIILENLVLIVFLLAYLVRSVVFKKKKETDPWMWFYLKLIEKVLEFFAIGILCATMTTKGTPAKKPKRYRASAVDPKRRERTVRSQKQRAGRPSKKSRDGGDGVALTAVSSDGANGPWVKTKDAAGRTYFFHADTKETVWKIAAKTPTMMALSDYKKRQAERSGVPMQDVEQGSINPLNVQVDIPPPPTTGPSANGTNGTNGTNGASSSAPLSV